MADTVLLGNAVIDTLVIYNNAGDGTGTLSMTISRHGDGSYSFTDADGKVRRVRSHAAKDFAEFYRMAEATLIPVA